MMMDSERFAFTPRRLHAFETSGNAYDASQTDEAIKSGHTLVVLSERIVALAGTWPIAVTAELGVLHGVKGLHSDTLEGMAKTLWLSTDDIVTAVAFARALGFALDPAFERVCPTA